MASRKKPAEVETKMERRLRFALEQAREKGRCAWSDFARKAHRTPDGRIAGTCGDEIIVAHDCSPEIGSALKKVAEAEWKSKGCYTVGALYEGLPEYNLQGYEVYMEAAAEVLNAHFAGEAQFYGRRFLD